MTTPSSIEKQLCEYRLRKQREAEEKRQMTPTTDVPSTSTHRPSKTAVEFLNPVFNFIGSIGAQISNSLYSAVAPDHLQQEPQPRPRPLGQTNGAHDAGTDAGPHTRLLSPEEASDSDDDLDAVDQSQGGILARILRSRSKLEWATFGFKVLLWFLLWELFIIWQFGAVYFLFSGFVFIWYNLRTGPRTPGEVSAYSVFNRDLRRIDGTVSAEQLQREMLFRI